MSPRADNARLHTRPSFDVAVAGGGAVGATLACALADTGARVLLADPAAVDARSSDARSSPAFVPRPLAVSLASQRVLRSIGVWGEVGARATPIRSIHVSEAGRFGAVRLEAAECAVESFGSVVSATALGTALREAVGRRSAVRRTGGHIVDANISSECVTSRVIEPDGGGSFSFAASLLVVADGGRSKLRDALGIGTTARDYRQSAIASVATVRTPRAHTAYERFTPDGPVALLPMGGARYGLVWSCEEALAERLAGMPAPEFTAALDAVFGGRLGGIEAVDDRIVFPLRLVRADTVTTERVVLIGNAANHLHPVAGQGFNLGVRDAACLVEVVANARREGCASGDASTLKRFRRWRKTDHAEVARFTDALIDIFGHRFSPVALARAPALVLLDLAPPLKHALARRAMGLAGKVPRLALGQLP